MFLEKWYADLVDGDRVEIFYRANLKVGPVVLGYAGVIGRDGRASRSFVPGGIDLPRLSQPDFPDGDGTSAATVQWPAPPGQDAFSWHGRRSPEYTLWAQAGQVLTWTPVVSSGAVSGAGLSPKASGYVERLTLDFGPWHLGIRRLKWGRFCGSRHDLVWLEWEGSHPMRLALLDGRQDQLLSASPDLVQCAGAALSFTQRHTLVDESLDQGALRNVPLSRDLIDFRFLTGVETKWIAQAQLSIDDQAVDAGHAIYEEVTWP